jgi:mRNA-degrading endonuclease toxin of MazEF toxin-antitoxin module
MKIECKTKIDCFEEYHKRKIKELNICWIIGILIAIIVFLLTYKFWGKDEPLQDLISIGSGFVSIALAIFAIFYSFTENIKANQKELKVDNILDNIKENVEQVNEVLNDVEKLTKKTNTKIVDIEDMIKSQLNFADEQEGVYSKKGYSKEENINNYKEKNKEKQELEMNDNNQFINYILRGNIYLGKVNDKYRPVIVASNDIVNKYSPNVNIIPITSRITNPKLPTHVKIDKHIFEKDAVALVELVNSVPKENIMRYLGTLPKEIMDRVDDALLIQFGIKNE